MTETTVAKLAGKKLTTRGKFQANLLETALYEEAIRRREATLTAQGALVAYTGQHTGRSPFRHNPSGHIPFSPCT